MEYEFKTGDDLKKSRFGWNTKYSLKEIIENKALIENSKTQKSNKQYTKNLIELI